MRMVLVALMLMAAPAHAIVGPSTEGGAQAAHVIMILKRSAKGAGFCSGVVLAPDVVLTAAHCVSDINNMQLFYRDASGAPVLLPVAAVSVHPDYHADAKKTRVRTIDMALVKSATPLPAPFAPATLDESGAVVVGTPYSLTGFGLSKEGNGKTGGTLRNGAIEARAPISKVLLWARDRGNSGTGACTGDSGGPIFDAAGKVVAIANWADGYGKALCGSLTQGTLVAPQRGWMEGVLRGWGR